MILPYSAIALPLCKKQSLFSSAPLSSFSHIRASAEKVYLGNKLWVRVIMRTHGSYRIGYCDGDRRNLAEEETD